MAKHLSRAKRCAAACDALRKTAEEARNIAASIEAETNPTVEFMTKIKAQVEALDVDVSELEDLKGEIEEWRDNMPESLQGGDKYSTLDETANTLDSAISELEGVTFPEVKIPDPKVDKVEVAKTEFSELSGTLEELADTIEAQCDEAEGAEFPGMMG